VYNCSSCSTDDETAAISSSSSHPSPPPPLLPLTPLQFIIKYKLDKWEDDDNDEKDCKKKYKRKCFYKHNDKEVRGAAFQMPSWRYLTCRNWQARVGR